MINQSSDLQYVKITITYEIENNDIKDEFTVKF
jgi:hypothetical protein